MLPIRTEEDPQHTDSRPSAEIDNQMNTSSNLSFTRLVSRLVSYTSQNNQPSSSSSTNRNSDDTPLLNVLNSFSGGGPRSNIVNIVTLDASTQNNTPTSPFLSTPASPPADYELSDQLEAGLGGLPSTNGSSLVHQQQQTSTSPTSLANDAARHRLANGTTIDIRNLARSIEKSFPFVALFLVVFLYRHLQGLVVVGWGTFVLMRVNSVIRIQVAMKEESLARPLLGLLAILAVHIRLLMLFGPKEPILNYVLLQGSVSTNFFDVLFIIVAADLLLRYCLSAIKICAVLLMRCDTPARCRKRGGFFTAVDYTVMVYRAAVPAPLWLGFLQRGAGLGHLMASACSGVYLILKAANIMERISLAIAAVAQWRNASFGTAPSKEEIEAADNQCAVCQESFRSPVRLQCSHIFCEDCVSEWLEREPTCPMCRARVRGPLKPMGDGSTALFPNVF